MSGTPWKVRAIQLDLARQRETVDAIQEFIRFSAEWGYNTLFLYLEGVVKTRSFPYRPDERSYTPDDMRRVVAAAAKAHMDVVPCVATLGHSEHFLTTPELKHLDAPGDFGGPMFDPAKEETYKFLADYLHDIAECFPSQNIHIGCDEAWRLGRSPSCIARRAKGETYADLLIKHIERMNDICASLGKRPWIWSDLLEYLSDEEIARIPRSVLMCSWHYTAEHIDRRGVCGHFDNLKRRDWLSLFERLGFDVVVCPYVGNFAATEELTRYALNHSVIGGLQTVWELGASFLPALLPCVAASGAWWQNPRGDFTSAVDAVLKRLFPGLDNIERLAIRGRIGGSSWVFTTSTRNAVVLTAAEQRDIDAAELQDAILQKIDKQRLPSLQRRILTDLQATSNAQVLAGRFRRILPSLARGESLDDGIREAARIVAGFRAAARERAAHWEEWRPGIVPERASVALEMQAVGIESFITALAGTDRSQRLLLYLDLFLWEAYSCPRLTVELRHGTEWHEVLHGICKPQDLALSQFRYAVPVTWPHAMPDAVRISVAGFGGEGLRYVSVDIGNCTLVPKRVINTSGTVHLPEMALTDNAFPCYLGSIDTVAALMNATDKEVSSITIALSQG